MCVITFNMKLFFLNLQAKIILVITVLCKSCHILIRILLEMSTTISLSCKGLELIKTMKKNNLRLSAD